MLVNYFFGWWQNKEKNSCKQLSFIHFVVHSLILKLVFEMKEVTLKVPEKEYSFLMKLIKNLGFVKVK
jgi:hypothetical protein